ncbi:uncharacterized protein KGF55_000471 [Candida pseudojiufengensis]|uniref:uncharacterized protein n=1 Tax=Candida pseudojiufengensis TaxID=497109 RepID=UPI002224DE8C|nr:uncharacterized protein KGF55_000471 [Candida pseudojiufengensis]KAI5966162.1 hypothetical protein KGF55_000471 [Candida pseudojiufengensis]
MSSEFLRSSPARDDTEDIILNKIPSITQTPASKKLNNKSIKQEQQNIQSNSFPIPIVPPSTSKYFYQPPNLSGWTPLISKTYSNEQFLSFNSTPNKLFISSTHQLQQQGQQTASAYHNSLLNQHTQSQQHQQSQSQLHQQPNDYEYQGFGLTPFINHNFNIMGNTSISQFNNITPYNEKLYQQNCEFFIDSPIRSKNNNNIEQQNFTITPSKFSLNNVVNSKKIFQDPSTSATKRSITLVDTPPRQPHKLSITTKASNDDEEASDNNIQKSQIDGSQQNSDHSKSNYDKISPFKTNDKAVEDKETEDELDEEEDEENKDQPTVNLNNEKQIDKNILLQTPCKKPLKDISNNTNLEFNTPVNKQIVVSSPTTIILTSTKKSTSKVKEELNDKENIPPPSPTPAKISLQPKMGVFSENNIINNNKPKSKPKPKPNSNQNQKSKSKSTKNLNSNTSSSKPSSQAKTYESSTNSSSSSLDLNPTKSRQENKAKMQKGMNKFQIVLSDVTPVIPKKKSKDKPKFQQTVKQPTLIPLQPPGPPLPQQNIISSSSSQPQQNIVPSTSSQTQPQLPPSLNNQSSSVMDHNITMNSLKEHSSIISHSNNSINSNSSHLNLTTDHSSFDIGGISSTPNSKILLDRIFEKQSPQQLFYLQQPNMHHHHNQQQQFLQPQIPSQQQSQLQQGSMLPPQSTQPKQNLPHQSQQQPPPPPPQQQNFPIMSMMSTPQHSHIYNRNDPNNQQQFLTNMNNHQQLQTHINITNTNVFQIPSPWNYAFGTPQNFSIFNNQTSNQNILLQSQNNNSSSSNNLTAAVMAAASKEVEGGHSNN